MPNFQVMIDLKDSTGSLPVQGNWLKRAFGKETPYTTKLLLISVHATEEAVAKLDKMGVMDHVVITIPQPAAQRQWFANLPNAEKHGLLDDWPYTVRQFLTSKPMHISFDDEPSRARARAQITAALKALSEQIDNFDDTPPPDSFTL